MNTLLIIKDLLREAESSLHTSASPRLDAEVLLCNVLDFDRSKLYSCPENIISAEKIIKYRSLIGDRQQGKPVAYLTGRKEFWSLEFHVNEHTLIPRPETECLVEAALEHISADAEFKIADLGTGSGAIAIAIASERSYCHIIATDICDNALAVARSNAVRMGTSNINFINSDWYAKLHESFDLIVSNPPYIRNDDEHLHGDGVAHEPGLALCGGADGLDAIRHIIGNSPRFLNADGWLLIEHGCDQAHDVHNLFEKYHFTDIKTLPDYAGLGRVTRGRYCHE